MKKRGDSNYLFLLIAIIIIAIVGVSFKTMILDKPESQSEKQINPWQRIESSNETGTESQNSEGENEIESQFQGANEGGGSSGGGGSGDEEVQTSNPGCTTRTLTYSIVTLNQTEICEQYEKGYCTNKTVYCSAKIKNSDDLEGEIEMELMFFPNNEDKDDGNFYRISKRYLLGSKESVIMEGKTNINSEGEEGIANQKINCFFNTLSELQGIIC